MKKINEVMYHKLLIQANEAKVQGLTKLASAILNAVGAVPEDENVHYNYQQLENDIYQGMWRLATHVIKYYDVDSADAGKMNDRIEVLAGKFLQELETSLGVDEVVAGPLESPLFGQNKFASAYHNSKKNGYVDLTAGGWGVILETRKTPQPGDLIGIELEDGTSVEEVVGEVLHAYPGKGGIPAKDGKLGQYLVSIVSQDRVEKIMGGQANL